MPRRAKAKAKEPDFDFKIYVDPSCLSAPMDEETTNTTAHTNGEEKEIVDVETKADDTIEHDEPEHEAVGEDSVITNEESELPGDVDAFSVHSEVEEGEDREETEDPANESILASEPEDEPEPVQDADVCEEHLADVEEHDVGEDLEASAVHETNEDDADIADASIISSSAASESAEQQVHHEEDQREEEEKEEEEGIPDMLDAPEASTGDSSFLSQATNDSLLEDIEQDEGHATPEEILDEDDEATPRPTQREDDEDSVIDDASGSRRQSESSDRRTSLRTEALIQAAARAVMAKIENRNRDSTSDAGELAEEGDSSILSSATHEEPELEASEATYDADDSAGASRRDSSESTLHHTPPAPRSLSGDDGGDSSSHHELDEDDVFSDNHSARSSLSGSLSGGHSGEEALKSPKLDARHRDSFSTMRSPRMSGVSIISGLSQYEKDEAEFIPTTRDAPRMPFRTPSSVRALQMSSPTPSVFAGSTPRSHHKKRSNGGSSNFPTISRLGSPTVSAQYSPKGRTPTRFKPRQEAPLVLLHVTLLPLRWMWADVIDNLDAVTGKDSQKDAGPAAGKFEPSDDLRTLRDAWRQLQDRVGDTVLERGILLPHPQNDYEILEERLLEALDLPLRRRARILECGHYLGPANLTADDDFSQDESEDEYRPASSFSSARREKRHWCGTCKHEIKYEDLGPGKIFRVKVYASNGLMKAGAWEACWKEMERVDIEVEPIVEPAVQGELEKLAALEDQLHDLPHRDGQPRDSVDGLEPELLPAGNNPDRSLVVDRHDYVAARSPAPSSPPPADMHVTMHASPLEPPPASVLRPAVAYDTTPYSSNFPSPVRPQSALSTEPVDRSEARRLRDEARMREIYGEDDEPHVTPQLQVPSHHPQLPSPTSSMHAEPTTSGPRHPDSYIPPKTPKSPSEEAYERREARGQTRRPYQSASLPELLLEVVKVLMRDPKNVAIMFLGVLAMFFMLRTAPAEPPQGIYRYEPRAEPVVTTEAPVIAATPSVVSSEISAESSPVVPVAASSSAKPAKPVKSKERKVIRVVETVTETVSSAAPAETVYETETIKVTVSQSVSASASASAAASVVPVAEEVPAYEGEMEEEAEEEAEEAEEEDEQQPAGDDDETPIHDEI
ncbi:hypothetical protein GQ53DRAFT_753165 [Thozetella sp. PMI_491]|nr:hypothetical protein GQ53DRAFT_753165 [Thozetella sp. PMI_491]